MEVNSRINIKCTKKATDETIGKLNDFCTKYDRYLVDRHMGIYVIPVNSEIYNEVTALKERSPKEIYFYEFFE